MSSNSHLVQSGSGSAAGFQTETVTLKESAFANLEFYAGSAGGFIQHWLEALLEAGVAGVTYPVAGLGGLAPHDIELSADFTQMHVADNGGTNLYNVNLATGVSSAAIPFSGAGLLPIRRLSIHPTTGVLWAYGVSGGTAGIFTIDTTTGVATLLGPLASGILQANSGIAFAPDGRLFACEDPGTTSYVREINRYTTGAPGSPVVTFRLGNPLIFMGDTGTPFRGPMAFTARNTILSQGIVTDNVQEYNFSGAVVRGGTNASISSGGAIAYYNPLLNRGAYVGAPIRRLSETDALGNLVATTYYTENGDVITPAATDIQQVGVEFNEPVEAIHTTGTILGTALTTSYQNLIVETKNLNGSGKILQVYNGTDQNIFLQFTNQNSSVDQIFVPSGGATTLDYSSAGRVASGNLRVRALAAAGISGSVYALLVR